MTTSRSGSPRRDSSRRRSVGSTGSPLSPEGVRWGYRHGKEGLWLAPLSGGTDGWTAFIGGCPVLPVYAGEMQCRYLGAKVEAFSQEGKPLIEEMGELVMKELRTIATRHPSVGDVRGKRAACVLVVDTDGFGPHHKGADVRGQERARRALERTTRTRARRGTGCVP